MDRRCLDRSCTCNHANTRKVTQAQLEALYTGPDLFLDERYAQMLTAIFVCTAYSTGIPLLMPICVLFFAVLYWVDKYMFVNVYRTPPRYAWHLAERSSSLLPYAVLIHLVGAGLRRTVCCEAHLHTTSLRALASG